MSTAIEYVTCGLCDSDHSSRIGPYYAFGEDRCHLVKCDRCGCIFVNPRPTLPALRELYVRDYFESGGNTGVFDRDNIDRRTRGPDGTANILRAFRRHLAPGKKLLEIGCADGFFLSIARDQGWQVTGVDISEYAAHYARTRRGLDVRSGVLEDMAFPDRSFAAVLMNDVLEHLRFPRETLREVHRVMEPGGGVFIALPLWYNGLYERTIGRLVRAYRKDVGESRIEDLPVHLYEFTPATLTSLLHACGFRVTKLVTFAPAGESGGSALAVAKRVAKVVYNASLGHALRLGSRGVVVAERYG